MAQEAIGVTYRPLTRSRGWRALLAVTLLAALSCLDAIAAASGPFMSLRAFSREQGLSQLTVTAIVEDGRGYLWVGTQEGLNRFDGRQFRTVRAFQDVEPGLASDSISALAVDERSRMWIGTQDAGLQLWDLTVGRWLSGQHLGLAHLSVGGIVLDGAKGAWVSHEAGIDYVPADFTSARAVLAERGVVKLHLDDRGGVWALSRQCGLWRLTHSAAEPVPIVINEVTHCTSMTVSGNAILISTADSRLVKLDVHRGLISTVEVPGPSAHVRHLLRLHDGQVLMGHADGQLATWTGGDELPRAVGMDQRVSSGITQMYETRDGVIWLGSHSNGLFRALAATPAVRRDALGGEPPAHWPSPSVRSYLRDGRIDLLGTDAGLLLRRAVDQDWQFVEAIGHSPIRVLESRHEGGWWVGTDHGLFALAADLSAHAVTGLPHPQVSAVLVEEDGVWVATRGGLARLSGDVASQGGIPDALKSEFLTALLRDRQGRLWIGSDQRGAFVWAAGAAPERLILTPAQRGSDSVWSIHESTDALWFGTFSAGLYRLDKGSGRMRVIDTKHGLTNGVIYRIEEDRRGRLWLSTNAGINLHDPQVGTVHALSNGDGLHNIEFNSGASFQDQQGRLYFGGTEGLDVIDPDAFRHATGAPRPVISGTALSSGPGNAVAAAARFAYPQRVELDYWNGMLSLDLAVLDFRAPGAARMRYRLSGAGLDWIYPNAADAELLLSHLPAGDYRLEVQAAGRDGRWSPSAASLDIRVSPPWWDTMLARAMAVTLLLCAVLAVFVAQQRRLLRAQRLSAAYARFVPHEFLRRLGRRSMVDIELSDHVQTEATLLFSDVRGFTSQLELMSPEDAIDFVNQYLAMMEPLVQRAGGFVESYIGDGIVAVFPSRPDDALIAAQDMLVELDTWNNQRRARSEPEIKVGIGVASGEVMLGAIGAPRRIKCGVIGDCVNLASRIESLTKHYRLPILIADTTYCRLQEPGRFRIREIDRVRVMGRTQPLSLYEVLVAHADPSAEQKWQSRAELERAMAAYRAGLLSTAVGHLQRCQALAPLDPLPDLFLSRCKRQAETDPGEQWDAIESLDFK